MADNEVSIVLTAIDNASSKIKGIGSTFKELTGINLGAAASLAGVGVALRAAGDFARDSINFFIDYSMEVKDMARVTGESTEEMSKLIQVADDVRLSTGTLTAAFRQMSMKGIDPNIESIMRLADEYKALSDPLERNQLLLQNFGRAGLEMGKMLEMGSAGIRAAGDEAERLGLVLGKQDIEAADRARLSMDEFSDTVNGLKIILAEGLLPAITDITAGITQAVAGTNVWGVSTGNAGDALSQTGREFTNVQKHLNIFTDTLYKSSQTAYNSAKNAGDFKLQLRELGQSAGLTQDEIAALVSISDKLYDSFGGATYEAYNLSDALVDVKDKAGYVEEVIAASSEDFSEYYRVIREATQAQKDFGDTSEFVKDMALAGDLAELAAQEGLTADEIERATSALLFQKIAASLDAAAALELAKQWGLLSQLDYDVARGLEDITNQFDRNGIEGIQAEEATTRYYAAMNNLKAAADAYLALPDEYTKTYTFETYYKTYGQAAITAQGPGFGQTEKNWDQFGGQWTVPSKYGYEGYNLPGNHSASPGETITVTPGGRETPRSELSDKSITALSQAIKLAILGY